MPTLFVLSGPDIGRTHELDDGAVLGRSPECEAPLRGSSVSRRHARLEQRGASWFLVDLGSRNGIRRGELRVEEVELEDGGTVTVGDVELRFRLEVVGGTEAPPPRRAPAPVPPPPPVEELPEDEPLGSSSDDEGIVFEGEELFDAEPPAPVTPAPAPTPPAPAAPTAPSPGPEPASAGRPAPSRAAERLARAGIRPRAGAESGGVQDSGRPILQYSREASGGGLLSADLGQYPGWVRALIGALVLGIFAGLFWLAFRMASSLGERSLEGGDSAYEEPLD